ncbi:histidine kinase [Idiomarina sp. PL1-037]|uniref:sensor histidine kinase n=1 Tax=Idiomarina sp. PL1-037 TaxID=3095365 RepID=UPI002ACC382B|nr:histidine kinase [Idiomarina sp. PL1-037]WQC51763.1 histidine kinase [Idiomarina sp. PL1-037]
MEKPIKTQWQLLMDNRNRFFWLLQAGGWIGYALVNYIGSLMHEMRDIYTLIIILGAYAGFLSTIPLRYLYRRIWEFPPALMVLIAIVASYITAVAWAIVDNATYWEIYKFGFRPDSPFFYLKNSLAKFYIILSWSGLYFGIKYYQMLQEEKQKALLASSMAHQAQLKMLRYQLNPHFLFNTLNAISTLILLKENEKANLMVNKLSHFLRFSLDNEPIKKVTLEKEVDALLLYLDIEKVRFDEMLEIDIHLSDETKSALVPSLICQPLIENSIKYAISNVEGVGKIRVRSWSERDNLILEVCDNGPKIETDPEKLFRRDGVGLNNTRQRLKSLYGKQYRFEMLKGAESGLCVRITIPMEMLESQR